MNHAEKESAYYKAVLMKATPPYVPSRVRVLFEGLYACAHSDAGVAAGDYDCKPKLWGQVEVQDRAGKHFCLNVEEFLVLQWMPNVGVGEMQGPAPLRAGEDQTEATVVPQHLERDGFTRGELVLRSKAWRALVHSRQEHLHPSVREWLAAWNLWDLACSPMDDNERRMIRYGHYLGWWDRRHSEMKVSPT